MQDLYPWEYRRVTPFGTQGINLNGGEARQSVLWVKNCTSGLPGRLPGLNRLQETDFAGISFLDALCFAGATESPPTLIDETMHQLHCVGYLYPSFPRFSFLVSDSDGPCAAVLAVPLTKAIVACLLIAVRPDKQRQGLGTHLLDALESETCFAGASLLLACVSINNRKCRSFFMVRAFRPYALVHIFGEHSTRLGNFPHDGILFKTGRG